MRQNSIRASKSTYTTSRIYLLVLILCSCNAYSAEIFEFSFDNDLGTVPGTITGTIQLDFLNSSNDSGTGPASNISITSTPPGIPVSNEGNTVTNWQSQGLNSFTVLDGVITDYQFGASEGAVPTTIDNVMCLNNGAGFTVAGVYICTASENYFGDGFDYAYNADGIAAVQFQRLGSNTVSVPINGTWIIVFVIGFIGLFMLSRKQQIKITMK